MGLQKPKSLALQSDDARSSYTAGLLSVEEACVSLRISKWQFYRLVNSRQLKTLKLGGRRFVPIQAIQSMLENLLAEADA